MGVETFEACRGGEWIRVAPADIRRGELYRRLQNGIRTSHNGKSVFIGPVDMMTCERKADNAESAVIGGSQDDGNRPVENCWGFRCEYAVSGTLPEYGEVSFLKCAKQNNRPVMDMSICPVLKWRRNRKGEVSIDGHQAI